MATNFWFLKFPSLKVYHLQYDNLDHRPLLIVLEPLDLPQRKKPFQFEEMWLSNWSCEETVLASWNHTIGTNPNKDIIAKVEKCGIDLSWWNRNVFGSIRKELTRKRDMLLRVENEAMVNGNNSWVRELNFEINVLLDREARMWAQWSRLLWATQGDKNTKYFHSWATKRFRKN